MPRTGRMSNITKFLCSRELGSCYKKWTPTNKVENFYDEIASKPVVNKVSYMYKYSDIVWQGLLRLRL